MVFDLLELVFFFFVLWVFFQSETTNINVNILKFSMWVLNED
jgi:hypothetical protein